MISHSQAIDQFRAAMRAQGVETDDPIVGDGRIHRVHVNGDRKGSKNGWYCLHLDDAPAGQFGCAKRHGISAKFSWVAEKPARPMSAEERKALRDRMAAERKAREEAERQRHAEAAAQAEAIWAAAKPATDDHPYLTAKGVKSHGLRVGRWEKVRHDTGEVWTVTTNALLVPMYDRSRKIHSLQAIFPKKILGKGTRDKDYLANGAKAGMFYAIGKPKQHEGRNVFVLVEGYATGASVHECWGHCALVTFDTANLEVVAVAIRERQPDAILLFAADNDQWTTTPVSNPGVRAARKAALAVNGVVAVPKFASLDGEPTDFNDLHAREGAAVVVKQLNAALRPAQAAAQPEPVPPPAQPAIEPPAPAQAAQQPPSPPEMDATGEHDDSELIKNGYFTILGYDGDDYFFFHHEKRQVLCRGKGDFSDVGLIELAPINWWEENLPGEKGINKKAAVNWIFRTANSRGIYDPTRVRGRGAWVDKGRIVYHHGGYLTVDGVKTDVTRIQSGYVYPMARAMLNPSPVPLTDAEGVELVEVAALPRWSKPSSAALMAGFTMLAPICGALSWRPHIWITGGAGTGKTTLQKHFCGGLTRGVSVYANGNSTEAGLRQELRGDARPVLIDEFESNDERERQRVLNVMSLIRQTSSETQAKTFKGTIGGTGMHFDIRSMFCLSSINTNLPTSADVDRLSVLTIKPHGAEGEDNWTRLESALLKIDQDETISGRLLARALNNMPIILEAVKVFRRVAAKHFARQRDGDQYGTLLAGFWCLQVSRVPTEAEALGVITAYDWSEHVDDADSDDAMRALEAILGAKLRVGTMGEFSVYEVLRESSTIHRRNLIDREVAEATLRRHGIRAEFDAGELWFGTGVTTLKQIVDRMPFVTDLRGQLLRVPGAKRLNQVKKFNGANSKCISIPLGPIIGEDPIEGQMPI